MRITSLVAVLFLASPAFAQPIFVVPRVFGEVEERYQATAKYLDELLVRELADKKIPSLAIALVDDQKVVWSNGYGFRDLDKTISAGAGLFRVDPVPRLPTVYRVGSVSKLFTDVAIMQLVEDGTLDLDAPVAKYVPEFKPAYKEGQKQITLRMLMAHRSGLIREPPVGNYFDPTEPSLEKSVLSLNGIELVYPPGERTKYSNAAIGLVGYVIQKVQQEKFEGYVQRRVLDLLDMESSSFTPTPAVKAKLAEATMWTYHGREFAAPKFELGVTPPGACIPTCSTSRSFSRASSRGARLADCVC